MPEGMIFSLITFLTLTLVGAIPDVIKVSRFGLQSNGLDHDLYGGYFIISSLTIGSIYRVDYDSSVETFVAGSPDYGLIGSSGVRIDTSRHKIHVANGHFPPLPNPSNGIQASWVLVNQTDKTVIKWVNLTSIGNGTKHAANDLDLDLEGNAYITDSYGAQIWFINGTTYQASTFVYNSTFNAVDGVSVGLNGILYHTEGYLICSKYGSNASSKLFRINIQDRSVIQINVTGALLGADGIEFDPTDQSRLYVAGQGYLYTLVTDDNYVSASVQSRKKVPSSCHLPTTITALARDQVYVICQQTDGFESIQFIQVPDEGASPWWWYFVIVIGLIVLTITILTPYWMKKCGCNRIKVPTPRVKDAHVELQEVDAPEASRSGRPRGDSSVHGAQPRTRGDSSTHGAQLPVDQTPIEQTS